MKKTVLKGVAVGTTISVAFFMSANAILSKEYNLKVQESAKYRTEKQEIMEVYNQSLGINEQLNLEIDKLRTIIEKNNVDYTEMQEKLNNAEAQLLKHTVSRTVNKTAYKVAIDMGHNLPQAKDTGATYNNQTEDYYTMEIGLRLKSILEQNGIMVINTTPSADSITSSVKESLDRRIDVANQNNVDLFLSIHLNSASNTSASGVETWIKDDNSRRIAEKISSNISSSIGIPDRGAKVSSNSHQGDLYVLKNSDVNAVLLECFFLSNQDDVEKYNVDKVANAIARAIIEELEGV